MELNNRLRGVKILTTDAEKRIGLYAIRYLGRAGGRISAVSRKDDTKTPIGFYSRYAGMKIIFEREAFFSKLERFLVDSSRGFDFVNPIDISQMLCVIDTDRKFNLNCNYLLPKRESLVIADDKELLTRHAQDVGLNCPRTLFRVPPDRISSISGADLSFPCIIKFRGDKRETHWNPEERYSIVHSRDELISEYQRMHEIEEYPIIQEYIRGQGFGVFALYDRKRKLKARFCHRRIREYPVTGGAEQLLREFL